MFKCCNFESHTNRNLSSLSLSLSIYALFTTSSATYIETLSWKCSTVADRIIPTKSNQLAKWLTIDVAPLKYQHKTINMTIQFATRRFSPYESAPGLFVLWPIGLSLNQWARIGPIVGTERSPLCPLHSSPSTWAPRATLGLALCCNTITCH